MVIVSNRGPVSFSLLDQPSAPGDDGTAAPPGDGLDGVVAKRGAGGLVSGLAPIVSGTDAIWVAAAMSDGDRLVAAHGLVETEGLRVRLVGVDDDLYRMAYDVIGNATLWFLHHSLWDLSRRPRFDRRWREAWDGYRQMNAHFAEVLADAAPEGAAVLIQDYHLTLVAPKLRQHRPDLALVHFHHTPFASAEAFRALPGAAGSEMLGGLTAHHACGFHSHRWAENFLGCCRASGERAPKVFVSPLPSDPDDIATTASSSRCEDELAALDAQIGGRRFIVRVDRIELSKNLVRGFLAFDELLERWPEYQENVVFGAFVYPSREGLPEYLAYRQEVETVVRSINKRWSRQGWEPILFDPTDDFPRSVAALRAYDVLLVNPIRDGLNLVAKEGPLVNERNGAVVLSTEAGVWSEIGDSTIDINPFDVSGTAEALAEALSMPPGERTELASRLRSRAGQRRPADWLTDLLTAAEHRPG